MLNTWKKEKERKNIEKHRGIGELEIFRHSIEIILYIFIRVQQSLSLRKAKKKKLNREKLKLGSNGANASSITLAW